MKVLLVTRAGIGGAARHVLDVVRGLAGRHEIVAAASPLEDASFPDRLAEAGARVVCVPMRRGPRPVSDHRGLAAIRGILAGERFDVVHAHTAKAGALARRAAAGAVPTIYSPHGFFHLYPTAPRPLRRAFLSAERWLGRRTTLLAACAEWEAARAVADGIVPEGSTTVVPNGIDIPEPLAPEAREAVRRELGVPPGGRLVLMAGRLKAPKDPRTFLSAATRFGPETVFGLAGDGPLLAACRRDAPPNARVLGARSDVPRLLLAADATILASRFEAAPYFLLEAMAAGLPVVATDLPATRETIGDVGLIAAPGDADALGAAIRRVLKEGAGFGERARIRVELQYGIPGMLSATEAVWSRAAR